MKGIGISFSDVKGVDLDFLDLHSKGTIVDGNRLEVIVINPDDELMNALNRLGIKYRNLSKEETYRYVRELFFE
jgi:signal transduction protein with GAF and PtsI domain